MNPRMLGLAAALFLIVPVGIGAADNPVLDLWAEASAIVSDVEIFTPPQKKVYDSDSFQTQEQLVEGHTVFATIELRANVTEDVGNVTITGVVHCEEYTRIQTADWMGIPVPTKIERAQFECYVGQRVIITPDPFSGDPGSLANPPSGYSSTGEVRPILSPDGQLGLMEELSFEHDGKTWYAWSVPVFEPWTLDGKTKNFIAPLPVEQLRENDASRYRVVLEEDLQRVA